MPDLLRALGDEAYLPGGANRAPNCPFCGSGGGKWTVKLKNDRYFFKCFKPACVANDAQHGHGEIGYLALRRGLSAKDACKEYLRMALPERYGKKEEEKPELPVFINPARSLDAGKNPWHALWLKFTLLSADASRITEKRGLSTDTLEAMGIASNSVANKPIVEQLTAEFPEVELVDLGILKVGEGGKVRPAGQLIGWGRTGKKDSKGEEIWEPDVGPPIIPYFGFDGTVIYLRPHKGGLSNSEKKFLETLELPDDDEEPSECAAHVYVPQNFSELLEACDGTAVFTEGEFKVGALTQAGIAAIACPGITFIRNPVFREELLKIIRHYGIRDLVVCFDNEIKNDPRLPGFKADPWKQHDTQLWAEYTAQDLFGIMRGRGGSVKVGRLPDALRENGKCDFDSILGALVREHGIEDGTRRARKIFRKVIAEATENPAADKELWPGNVRRIIDRKLHLLRNGGRRRLPSGGNTERELAKRFSEWDGEDLFSVDAGDGPHPVDRVLADAFRAVAGGYYERKQFLTKEQKEEVQDVLLPAVNGKITAARAEKQYEKLKLLYAYRRALYERLRGLPKLISTMTLRGEFKLRQPGGNTVRLVRVLDQRDPARRQESSLQRLTPEDAAQPSRFREWLLGKGSGTWMAGVEALDKLNSDIEDDVFLRDIHSVTHCGWHEETGIRFFGDCAFLDDKASKDGRSILILPDANGVFWNPSDGVGYLLDANQDGSNSTFALGLPKLMAPQRGEDDRMDLFNASGTGLGDELSKVICEHLQIAEARPVRELLIKMEKHEVAASLDELLAAAGSATAPLPSPDAIDPQTGKPAIIEQSIRDFLEVALARIIFTHLRDDLFKTVGDMDAWLALGILMAYAVGPELVHDYLCHPGLFFVGGFGSGKSETMRRMARIFGMRDNASVDLSKTTTANALIRTLAQYSSLPVCLDEYRRTADDQKERDNILRAATQRTQSHKATITSKTSTVSIPPRTSPMVAGENSPNDSATASRYVHLTFSAARRKPGSAQAWERIKANCPHYYHLGRWLMTHRARFARAAMAAVRAWMADDAIKQVISHDRVVLTTGVAYTVFNTTATLLGCPLQPEDATSFRQFSIAHGAQTLADVRDETFRNKFWRDICTGLNRASSGIKPKFFGQKYITLAVGGKPIPPEQWADTALIRRAVTHKDRPQDIFVTNLQRHPHAVPVVFVAAQELYDEWLRDLAGRRETCPISFTNLRAELEREEYWIPPSRIKRDGVHRQRFDLSDSDGTRQSKPYTCWCISLARRESTEEGSEGDYLFPFAQEIIDALESHPPVTEE